MADAAIGNRRPVKTRGKKERMKGPGGFDQMLHALAVIPRSEKIRGLMHALRQGLQTYAIRRRHRIRHKEILDQVLGWIDPIPVEIANAIPRKERVVDQEITAEVFGFSKNRIRRVRQNLG
jgi:hypothetical protein